MKSNATLKTVKNYADMQKVSTAYIYKLVKDKRMSAVVIDGVIFIDIAEHPTIKG